MEHTCCKCRAIFDPTESQLKRGDYICSPCNSIYQKAWRDKRKAAGNPVISNKISREYQSVYAQKYKLRDHVKKRKAYLARERRKDPKEKIKEDARRAVRSALKKGGLTRLPCSVCANERSEAHHPDYSKPIDVIWLCRIHHIELHAKYEEKKS